MASGKSWKRVSLFALLSVGCAVAFAQAPGASGPPQRGMGGATPGAQQEEANPPVIDSISYSGNSKISTAALARDAQIKPGVKITKAMVGGEIQRIVALYKKSGWDLSVSPDIQHPADGHVTVTIKIDENGKGGDGGAAAPANAGR